MAGGVREAVGAVAVVGNSLDEGKRDAVLIALKAQERAGIDINPAKRHHHRYSRRPLPGRGADHYRPRTPTRGIHAEEAAYARANTACRLKFTMPGPMTIVDTIADEHYGDRAPTAMAFARILN